MRAYSGRLRKLPPPRVEQVKVTLTLDDGGNSLYKQGAQLYLHLATEGRVRKIGQIDEDNKVLHVHRSRDGSHFYRREEAYGFNYWVMNTLPIETVHLRDEYGQYEIPAGVIKSGKCIRYKEASDGNDYDLQYLVKVDTILEYRIIF